MNIAIICRYLNAEGGGSNYSLHTTANYLAENNHNVSVQATCTYRPFSDQKYQSKYLDYNFTSSKQQELVRLVQYLREIETEYDLIHIYNPLLLPSGGIYRRIGGTTPIVGRLNTYPFCSNLAAMRGDCYENCGVNEKYIHDTGKTASKAVKTPKYVLQTFVYPKLLNDVDSLIAISPTVKEVFTTNRVKTDKITVIPNASERLKRSDIGETTESDLFRILYVGRIEKQKGVDLLINAVEGCTNDEEIVVDIVGDGNELESLKRLAQRTESDAKLNFHGRVDHQELPLYYSRCDVFVHPGRWPEPFGRTILEALEFGCPLIVSDIGAPPWIAGNAGVTFEVEDTTELTQRIETLQKNSEQLNQLSNNASVRFQRFLPDVIYSDLEELYRQVL